MRRDGRGSGDRLGLGDRATVDDLQQRGEQQRESFAARVDDPGVAQRGKQLRRVFDRFAGCLERALEHGHERRVAVERFDRLGRGARDREDRALDRAHHRLVRGIAGAPQARAQIDPAHGIEGAEAFHESAQDLRRDDAGVSSRAHERTSAHRLAHLGHRVGGPQLGAHRLERQRHVRTGVAVGHRVDVEPVQLLLVRAQCVTESEHRLAQICGGQAGQRRHRTSEYRGASLFVL